MTTEHHDEQPQETFIAPAKVRISAREVEVSLERPGLTRGKIIGWIGLVALVTLVAWVVFVLPDRVKTPVIATAKDPAPAAPARGGERSPFAEAQLDRQRKAAREVLQETLARQEALAGKSIETWAASEYQQAVDLASVGDEAYLQQDFLTAQQRYREAGEAFAQLAAQAEQRVRQAIRDGNAALDAGRGEDAAAAFAIALAIDPGNAAAEQGNKRAAIAGEVAPILSRARAAEAAGQLNAAIEAYRQAAAKDPASDVARQGAQRVGNAVTETEFRRVLGEGNAALQRGDLETARRRLQRAVELRSDSQEARTALAKANGALAERDSKNLLAEAKNLEAQERWHEAEQKYAAVLQLDANQADARTARDAAKTRAELDAAIAALLQQPDRLLQENVYTEALKLQKAADTITDAGPRLSEQRDRLRKTMNEVRSPIKVVIESDDKTSVTVFKVGNFGSFRKHEVALLPGKYTAVGIRKGYRDVRVEFTVQPGRAAPAVVVQCVEPI
ncbi:MAG: hypothetical protein IT494_01945 [Gammaproteobacteria bacterium]|nr:hypothetical protein [Gammaproteobacteria bacterium]